MVSWLLVVDDHDDGREMLSFLFTGHGFDVETAASGESALARIRERGLPAVVLTDVVMDVMDGFEVAHRLRKEAPSLEIFAYTAMDPVHEGIASSMASFENRWSHRGCSSSSSARCAMRCMPN